MVSLSPTQLKKPYYSNHEFYGIYKDRGERFLEKINKEEPFELTDGSLVLILKNSPGIKYLQNKEYNKLGKGKALFMTGEYGLISLTKFSKTKEFGAGGGIGAGWKNTGIQESTQCVFNSLIFNIKGEDLHEQDITIDNLSASYQFVDTTTPLEEIQKFSQNPIWQQSLLTSSNIIYSYISGSDFEHHRDSEFINNLYNSYKQTNINFHSDKWNPSDIWFVKKNQKSTLFSCSIDELNQQLENMFLNNQLIGISLKKLGNNPKIEIKNLDKTKNKKYQYQGHKFSATSKDITLLYNNGKICFRTFNFAAGWSGEILGENASHGKIGVGAINQILKGLNLNEIPYPKQIREYLETNKDENEFYIEYLIDKFINIGGEFDIFISEQNLDWQVSKYLGLILLDIIESQNKTVRNRIITQILNYASSELDESSIYMKLS